MENISPNPSISPVSSEAHIIIEPPRGWAALELKELWNYRELLFFLAWRDIKLRYKHRAWSGMGNFATPPHNDCL